MKKNTIEDLITVIKDGRFSKIIEDLQFEVATATSTPDEIVEAEHDIFMVLEYIDIYKKIRKELKKAEINNDEVEVYPVKMFNSCGNNFSVAFDPNYFRIEAPRHFSGKLDEFATELNEVLKEYSFLLKQYQKEVRSNRLNKIINRALEIDPKS